MGILTAFVLSLSGLLGQAESSAPVPAAAPQASPEARPVLPGESGHILKMTREMLELAKTHDSERRVDLFLRQARERLREREALEQAAPAPERDRLGRGLGDSYAKLAGTGATGAIECGAAEGRDMSAAAARYVGAARQNQEGWSRLAGAQPPDERPHYDGALTVAAKAPERVREAQEAGRAFAAQERDREAARSLEGDRDKTPVVPKDPGAPDKTTAAPPKGSTGPQAPASESSRREADPDRKDKGPKDPPADPATKEDAREDRKRDNKPDPKTPEHHSPHPHRPHR